MDTKMPELDLEDIKRQLRLINIFNRSELLAFKRSIEGKITHSKEPNIPWMPARKLTREQVHSCFSLRNSTTAEGKISFPLFEPREFQTSRSEWLAKALNSSIEVFRKGHSDAVLIVHLIIMEVISDLPGFPIFEQFKPGTTGSGWERPEITENTGGSYPPPKTLRIRAYNNLLISSTINISGTPTKVVGEVATGFCTSRLGHVSIDNKYFNDTCLLIFNISQESFNRWGNADMADDVDELSVYLAIMHDERGRWLKSVSCVDGEYTAYGVVTDGNCFRFLSLDKGMKVHLSPHLQLRIDLLDILKYFRHCFLDIINASPIIGMEESWRLT